MEAYVTSNVVAGVLVLFVVGALWLASRSEIWREAGRQLVRRRPIALAAIALYAAVAMLDSFAWVGGGDIARPRTVVDRFFPSDFQERSYSAPLAAVDFYGKEPLRYPARHLLGTDILGRDVFHMTLKGARVALLIGGFTSLIVIPVALLFGMSAGYAGGRWDAFVFFVMSTLASMPGLLLLVALIMVMGRGPLQVCVALGITGWVGFCRITRGETLRIRELEVA